MKKKHRIIAVLALLLGIGVMAYAGLHLFETHQIYREGDVAYSDLSSLVKVDAGDGAQATQAIAAAGPQVYIPGMDIDFEALKNVNSDSIAWLYCPDTVIDYPVMRADDYNYYLHHLPDGTANANGTLFIDYNCAPDFSDRLTVIYGHHMGSGKMFGGLKGYKDQSYYEEHPYMYLYTEKGNYRIDLLYGCVIGAGEWRDRAFMYQENTDSLLAYAAHNTTFESGANYKAGDRIVALSTCSYEFDNARYVVIGVLRSEYK